MDPELPDNVSNKAKKRIVLVGGGPSALLMCKRLIDSGRKDVEITIFERHHRLGSGMPYSTWGASAEHVTNVSDNEIPNLVSPIHEWVYTAPKELLQRFGIVPEKFNEYKVLPRLFFGEYLAAQFGLLLEAAASRGIVVNVKLNVTVTDLVDHPKKEEVWVLTEKEKTGPFDVCVICTGHYWPATKEAASKGYYNSPYPPSRLALQVNTPVAIRGSSLTAIDAVRTLARNNGGFEQAANGVLGYTPHPGSEGFKLVLHSRHGLLPALRFHLEESHLSHHARLTPAIVQQNRAQNNGFLSLDFVFETAFKEPLREKEPEFYKRIQSLSMEEFVEAMMAFREQRDPFLLLKAEYEEAETSIRRHESVYWKEMLAALSFTMNYPAKYFSAEDMLRLHNTLSHLISVIIAFVPQQSARELLALHAAGRLEVVALGADSRLEIHPEEGVVYHYKNAEQRSLDIHYKMFVDATGQPHLSLRDFPFKTLLKDQTLNQAYLKFSNPEAAKKQIEKGNEKVKKTKDGYVLEVTGAAINDCFQAMDRQGVPNDRLYIMAVPYISGYNPDYSGLDFCEKASQLITQSIFKG